MGDYKPGEAREWAREHMRGVGGTIIPTFTQDLKRLNERAIRHDVRRERELGFWGANLVSECATTLEEYRRFVEVAVDEGSKVGLKIILQASFDTLDDTIQAVRDGAAAGADGVLMGYPSTFHPKNEQEIFDFTEKVSRASHLGVILFPVHLWNFGRLHPSGFNPKLTAKMVREIPNVIAVKCEIGIPATASVMEMQKMVGSDVIVCDAFEQNVPTWIGAFGMRWMGTANYEYFGNLLPKYFELLHQEKWEQGMEIYWRLQPARAAAREIQVSTAGGNLIHRNVWKYQGWLSGFNGGPLRQPVMRILSHQMNQLRRGLVASGSKPDIDDDGQYFIGRNPE